MKPFFLQKVLPLLFLLTSVYTAVNAQSPGLIVQPKNGQVVTFLNPNTDKYTSKTAAGFVANDIGESEIPFKIIPSAEPEPTGDNNSGQADGATDFVKGADGSGFYTYYDGTNVIFRFRVGGKSNGARGYSVLLDTDLKIGNTGFYADPNFVPQLTQRSGNPGFELEIVYAQGKGVKILNVDGKVVGTEMASYAESTYSQISIALSKTGSDADYFVDFGVPASALGLGTQYIRLVGTTCISAGSALNNNASDVWGVNDFPHKNLIPNWITLINMQCGIGVTALSAGGSGICICTPAPTVNGPINPGTNVPITGVWNRLSDLYASQTEITLYKNSTVIGTTIATTGVQWSITAPSLVSGDTLYAMAQSAPESKCYVSNKIIVNCSGPVPVPNFTCATTIGMQGTIPLNATVDIYDVQISNNGSTSSPYTTKISSASMAYTQPNGATERTFIFYGNSMQDGTPCAGPTAFSVSRTVMVIVNLAGCQSKPMLMCLTSTGWNILTQNNTLALSNPIYHTTTVVNGFGGEVKDVLYRLFVNGVYRAGAISSNGSFSLSGLSLKVGDQLMVTEQSQNGQCQTTSPTYTVQCTQPPVPTIVSNGGEILSSASSIGGYATLPGATVTLYKGVAPSGTVVGSSTVNSAGEWLVSGLSLTKDETYYAVQTTNSCPSPASTSVKIVPVTPVCSSISGSYTESAAAINGTLPSPFTGKIRLYRDGVFLKSIDVTNAVNWSISVNADVATLMDILSPSDSLSVTSETPDGGETAMCSYIIVNCDIPPTPVATPSSTTILQGQAATFTLASSSNQVLYSVVDQSNNTDGTSVFGNGGGISLTTRPFNTPGTYNLKVAANNLAAPECRQTQNVAVTVNSSTLPVHFISTTVKSTQTGSRTVAWSVSGEDGTTQRYLVERSLDCNRFEAITIVPVQGNSGGIGSYTYTDAEHLAQKVVCYRIQAVNSNGSPLYSRVVSLSENKNLGLRLAPNPAKSETTLYFTSDREQMVTVDLRDVTGRTVFQKKVQVREGSNAVRLQELSNYTKGHYIVNVRTTTDTQHLKLIIN